MKIGALPPFAFVLFALCDQAFAQTYPANFSQVQVATGLSSPTTMAFAPDGRLFICQQSGAIKILKNGALLGTNFASFSVNSSGERGLLGLAFDPDFATNRYLYIYHTLADGSRNRLTRIRASSTNPDLMESGSATTLLDFDALSSATNHNGGFIKFGTDGKLYVAIGENANTAHAQNYDTYHGKLLRVNADGSAPSDNPFFASTPDGTPPTEQSKRVWAFGLRNPYTFDVQPGTGKIYVNDVGQNSWEEINDATAGGKNYGWPSREGTGDTNGGQFTNPVYAYGHGSGNDKGCAITGGAFFNPASTNYPAQYAGGYFYFDYCNGWINFLNTSNARQPFATGIPGSPVCMVTGPDGNLYFLSRGSTALYRIVYTPPASAPVITTQPISQSVPVGQSATFSVTATGTAPLSYQWRKGTNAIANATNASYTINAVATGDAGTYNVVVSNSAGSTPSNDATLTVTGANQPPTAQINTPASGATYAGGQVISFSGAGSDPEEGTLPASAFEWSVVFHHADHTHPGPAVTVAADGRSGSFAIPTEGETATDVFYRLYLTVRDGNGNTTTVFRDVQPRTTQVRLETVPAGLQLALDGTPVATPRTFNRVEGVLLTLGVVSPQTGSDGLTYTFSGWQHGGSATQTLPTPVNDVTYRATFTNSLRDPENPTNTARGVNYRYYEGDWNSLPNFDSLTPVKTGNVGTFTINPRNRNDRFGFVYEGFVEAPANGTYDFFTTSDAGSRLFIGTTLVVDNDGLHAAQERSGRIGLKQGLHAIRVEYFEKTGAQTLSVSYDGPTFTKRTIPRSALNRLQTGASTTNEDRIIAENPDVRVFPNPAGPAVRIEVSDDLRNADVRVYDARGQVVKQLRLNDAEIEFDTDGLPSGVYLIQIQYRSRTVTRRVVVTH